MIILIAYFNTTNCKGIEKEIFFLHINDDIKIRKVKEKKILYERILHYVFFFNFETIDK